MLRRPTGSGQRPIAARRSSPTRASIDNAPRGASRLRAIRASDLPRVCRQQGGNHEPHFAHLLRRAAAGARLRTGGSRRAAQAAGAGDRPVGGRPARLFLRRRQICRRARQGDHAGPDLCRGAGAEGRAPALSAGADPRRRPDRDQLDGHAGRPQGLGRVFRRAGLHRLHDRPADARPLGGASRRRPDADVHGRRTRSGSSPPASRPRAPGRRPRSTRNGRATDPTRARRAIRSSMRSTRPRSRP